MKQIPSRAKHHRSNLGFYKAYCTCTDPGKGLAKLESFGHQPPCKVKRASPNPAGKQTQTNLTHPPSPGTSPKGTTPTFHSDSFEVETYDVVILFKKERDNQYLGSGRMGERMPHSLAPTPRMRLLAAPGAYWARLAEGLLPRAPAVVPGARSAPRAHRRAWLMGACGGGGRVVEVAWRAKAAQRELGQRQNGWRKRNQIKWICGNQGFLPWLWRSGQTVQVTGMGVGQNVIYNVRTGKCATRQYRILIMRELVTICPVSRFCS